MHCIPQLVARYKKSTGKALKFTSDKKFSLIRMYSVSRNDSVSLSNVEFAYNVLGFKHIVRTNLLKN
jgi:hypothetical protein